MAFPERGLEISSRAGHYLGGHLCQNENLRPKIELLFGSSTSAAVFNHLARYLIRDPSQEVRASLLGLRHLFPSLTHARVRRGVKPSPETEDGGASVCVHLRSFLMSHQEEEAAVMCALGLGRGTRGEKGEGGERRRGGRLVVACDDEACALRAQLLLQRTVGDSGSESGVDGERVEWAVLPTFGRASTQQVVGLFSLY